MSGSLITTLQPNEIKPITVHLEPTGSIVGTVFAPDGQTPALGIQVSCEGCGSPVTTAADGTYRFDNVRLRTWTVTAADAQGRKRGLAKNVPVTANGQVVTANMTLIGLGTVTGRVLNPDNSSASSLSVLIHSLDPDFGTFYFPAATDAAGFYRQEGVVVGALTVNTGDIVHGLLGEGAGTLAHDGDTLTIDILLKSSAITLPVTRTDGNAFTFDIQKDGSIANGFGNVFGQSFFGSPGGASYLDITAGATTTRFDGANVATTENNGREIAVSQTNLAGLNVTRKVLVAPEYFARYLELLSNPTPSPITVDVRVQSNVRATAVVATSSGDAALGVTDPEQRRPVGHAEHRRRPGSVQHLVQRHRYAAGRLRVRRRRRRDARVDRGLLPGRQHAGAAELRLDERHDRTRPDGGLHALRRAAVQPRRRAGVGRPARAAAGRGAGEPEPAGNQRDSELRHPGRRHELRWRRCRRLAGPSPAACSRPIRRRRFRPRRSCWSATAAT